MQPTWDDEKRRRELLGAMTEEAAALVADIDILPANQTVQDMLREY